MDTNKFLDTLLQVDRINLKAPDFLAAIDAHLKKDIMPPFIDEEMTIKELIYIVDTAKTQIFIHMLLSGRAIEIENYMKRCSEVLSGAKIAEELLVCLKSTDMQKEYRNMILRNLEIYDMIPYMTLLSVAAQEVYKIVKEKQNDASRKTA